MKRTIRMRRVNSPDFHRDLQLEESTNKYCNSAENDNRLEVERDRLQCSHDFQ